jgi:hypothetical protein
LGFTSTAGRPTPPFEKLGTSRLSGPAAPSSAHATTSVALNANHAALLRAAMIYLRV